MLGLFKSKKEKLIDKYNKLLKESYELSNVSRKDSDAKLAEANKILEEIEAIGQSRSYISSVYKRLSSNSQVSDYSLRKIFEQSDSYLF